MSKAKANLDTNILQINIGFHKFGSLFLKWLEAHMEHLWDRKEGKIMIEEDDRDRELAASTSILIVTPI